MTFRIVGLAPEPFASLFALEDHELAARGIARRVADLPHAFPCRVSLEDAAPGEELLLLPFTHHEVATPYRASGPIYVRRNAARAQLRDDVVPDQLRRRLVSVRAYDRDGWMIEASVVDGKELDAELLRCFAREEIAYAQIHNARPGCFAATALRSSARSSTD
ncbi:MAG TPA: DUF1203 domain-containing protein [Kofleriaceae bacterium]|nr:DUF1203 domain-containing protein [Kofleriaceae bacterium]